MGGLRAALWVAVGAAFGAGLLCAPGLIAMVRRRRALGRTQRRALGETEAVQAVLRRGMPWCLPVARAFLRIPKVDLLFCEAERALCAKGHVTTAENLGTIWCSATLVFVVAGTAAGSSPVFGLALAACMSISGWFAVERSKEARIRALREGVPDALRAMEACFFAGLSLLQTFQHLAAEASGPLKELFFRAARELEAGRTSSEVLSMLKSRADISELSFVAIALQVQHDAGGSMGQILAAARDSVESDLELRRSLRVQTAQAKLSARVVTAMPFVLVAVFSFVSEDFLAPFFSSSLGFALLIVAVGMQAAGILIVRNMLRVGFD